ncbi:MAG: hypothetical protein ISQ32_00715 [Rickettsiales bacterium]|nr:hypothetical protein [Rickettsiales bacterium]
MGKNKKKGSPLAGITDKGKTNSLSRSRDLELLNVLDQNKTPESKETVQLTRPLLSYAQVLKSNAKSLTEQTSHGKLTPARNSTVLNGKFLQVELKSDQSISKLGSKLTDTISLDTDLRSKYHYFNVSNKAKTLPYHFTHLNICSSADYITSATPQKYKQNFVATTVQDALIQQLGKAINLKPKDSNNANIALGVLTIIPFDQDKSPFSIKVTRPNLNQFEIICPEDVYGKAQATFTDFQKLRSIYNSEELDDHPIVKRLISFKREDLHDGDIDSHQHQQLLRVTHHSEQFILAAISKTLDKILNIKDSEVNIPIHNATFLLDISTELSPCDHCMRAINDFMSYFRELIEGNNVFISRISWFNKYSNSFVSSNKTFDDRESIRFDEFDKNYFVISRINKTILNRTNNVFTDEGRNAKNIAPFMSRKANRPAFDALNQVCSENKTLDDSPIKAKKKSSNLPFKSGLRGMFPNMDSLKSEETYEVTDKLLPRAQNRFEENNFDLESSFESKDSYDPELVRGSMSPEVEDSVLAPIKFAMNLNPWGETGELLARIKANENNDKSRSTR